MLCCTGWPKKWVVSFVEQPEGISKGWSIGTYSLSKKYTSKVTFVFFWSSCIWSFSRFLQRTRLLENLLPSRIWPGIYLKLLPLDYSYLSGQWRIASTIFDILIALEFYKYFIMNYSFLSIRIMDRVVKKSRFSRKVRGQLKSPVFTVVFSWKKCFFL